MATKKQIAKIEDLYYSKEQTQEIEDMMMLYTSDGYDNLKKNEADYIIKKMEEC